ncbi:MAG: hypothetical protein ACRYG8_42180 [Janthinobacterium lividum]
MTSRPWTAAPTSVFVTATVVTVALPWVAFTNMVLFHFYVRGAFVLDSGLLGFLTWRSNAALTQPDSLGGGSFFAIHVAPLFLVTSQISWLLPISLPQFFAGFVGLSHVLLALAVFWLLAEGYGLRQSGSVWLAALAGVAFAFSGLAVAIARYPHFETYIAAFFLLFATARALGYERVGVIFLFLGLSTREDAGLHYAAVLIVTAAFDRWRGQRVRQNDWWFTLIAMAYSAAIILGQRLIFPGGSAFARVYLGMPPLGHIDITLISNRLLYLLVNRPYILLPALAAVIWAIRVRNPAVLVGYVAALPWLLLHVLAKSPLAGALSSYYAFPFLIALGWPLIAVLRQRQAEGSIGSATGPLIGFALLLALTFVPAGDVHNPGRLPLPEAFLAAPTRAQQAATDRAVATLSAARPSLGRLFVDNSVAAIDPAGFTRDEIPNWSGLVPPVSETPDTVVLMKDGYDADRLRAIAAAAGLSHHYNIMGTQLRVVARRRLDDTTALIRVLGSED